MTFFSFTEMVRKEGLEPSHLAVLTPEASASTNSATFASSKILIGDPDENRTHDHQLRKLILYPTELRGHFHHRGESSDVHYSKPFLNCNIRPSKFFKILHSHHNRCSDLL